MAQTSNATYRRTVIGGRGIVEAHQRLRGTHAYNKAIALAGGWDAFLAAAREWMHMERDERRCRPSLQGARRHETAQSDTAPLPMDEYRAKLIEQYQGLDSATLRQRLHHVEAQDFADVKRRCMALGVLRNILADTESAEQEAREKSADWWDGKPEPKQTTARNAPDRAHNGAIALPKPAADAKREGSWIKLDNEDFGRFLGDAKEAQRRTPSKRQVRWQ